MFKTEKSRYSYTVPDVNEAKELIDSFLKKNEFSEKKQVTYKEKEGEIPLTVYRRKAKVDEWLEYGIRGNEILILAYLDKESHPVPLHRSAYIGEYNVTLYRNYLNDLLYRLQMLEEYGSVY